MTPGRARPTLPPAVIGLVIALCAVLLLKWLAVVALVAAAVVLLVGRWRPWRRDGGAAGPRAGDPSLPDPLPAAPRPADPRSPAAPGGAASVTSAVVSRAPRSSPDDCSWCGLTGGHRTVDGALRRPRNVHAAR